MTSKMKIVVVGGSGYAGSAIAREAAKRGHAVTSLSRSVPEAKINGVTYAAADALKGPLPLGEAQVVVGALSPRGDQVGALARAYENLAAQARDIGARLVLVGGFSCLRPAAGAARMIEGEAFPPDVPREVVAEARENMDVPNRLVADTSGVDWLFVSPGMEFSAWMPGEELGRYRVGGEIALFDETGKSANSGPDCARAVLDKIETPKHRRVPNGVAH